MYIICIIIVSSIKLIAQLITVGVRVIKWCFTVCLFLFNVLLGFLVIWDWICETKKKIRKKIFPSPPFWFQNPQKFSTFSLVKCFAVSLFLNPTPAYYTEACLQGLQVTLKMSENNESPIIRVYLITEILNENTKKYKINIDSLFKQIYVNNFFL